jgi:hypothetical protein
MVLAIFGFKFTISSPSIPHEVELKGIILSIDGKAALT